MAERQRNDEGRPRDVLARAREGLAERGVRFTAARRLVLGALQRARGPMSAAELHRGLRRRVPLSSLYRTLTGLDEAGVLDRFVDATGVTRFELAEPLAGHHHHLTCVRCGATEDLDLHPEIEDRLAGLASEAASGSRWGVVGHRLDLEGLCGSCG
ncbi:MAG TPA: Fur family transcriptional regulator [Actinomycetota bacterium]